MIYSDLVCRAIYVAEEAHKGTTDRGGYPYIAHALHVAESMDTEEETVVAILHDVIEDCGNEWYEELEANKIPENIQVAVDAITRRKGESYEDYMERVKRNKIARKVKMSDLIHNSDLSRLFAVTEKDIERREKYLYWIKELQNISES